MELFCHFKVRGIQTRVWEDCKIRKGLGFSDLVTTLNMPTTITRLSRTITISFYQKQLVVIFDHMTFNVSIIPP